LRRLVDSFCAQEVSQQDAILAHDDSVVGELAKPDRLMLGPHATLTPEGREVLEDLLED
jgi:hypothetical protein